MSSHIFVIFAVSCLIAFVITTFGVGVLCLWGPKEAPKDRGLHLKTTRTSGGIAIVLGSCLAVSVPIFTGVQSFQPIIPVVVFSVLMGVLGLLDDIFVLGARLRLTLQISLSLWFCIQIAHVQILSLPFGSLAPGPVIGVLGSALWLVVTVNTVNFMDGANGLASGAMVIALLALALIAKSGHGFLGDAMSCLAVIVAFANLGFLLWNCPLGWIFQGDVGAFFSTSLFSSLVLLGSSSDHAPAIFSPWVGPLILLPLLTDVFLTLIKRARRGENLLQAHRDHLYQSWILGRMAKRKMERALKLQQSDSHRLPDDIQVLKRAHFALSLRIWGLMALSGFVAVLMSNLPDSLHSLVFGAGLLMMVLAWIMVDRHLIKTKGPPALNFPSSGMGEGA